MQPEYYWLREPIKEQEMMALRQPNWDQYETALLIESYWAIKADRSKKGKIVAELSSFLRKRATFEIDYTFRNENGINMRLGELDYLFSYGSVGLKNTSDLFREMVNMYLNNKPEYEKILLEAKEMNANTSNVQAQFCEWLQKKAPKLRPETVCQLLNIGEEFCKKIKVLNASIFETTDVDIIKKYVKTITNNKIFRIRNKKQYPAIVNAANWYYSFIRILPELIPDAQEEQKTTKPWIDAHSNETIRLGDNILDYFELIKADYPEFVFTNHNAKGKLINRAVYIFSANVNRHGNVLFEIWHLSTEGRFDIYIKKSFMSEEESKESFQSCEKATDTRGRITRQWRTRHELTDFLVSKLDLAKQAMGAENRTTENFGVDDITASFDGTQDYGYTKPLWFRYKGKDKELVSTWSKLYTSLMKQLAKDYPSVLVPDLVLLSGERIDIAKTSESYKLRRYSQLTNDLLVEINISANGFMKRISATASMIGLSAEDIEIHYTKRNGKRRGEKADDSPSDSNGRIHEQVTAKLVEQVNSLIRDSDDGISKNAICETFSNYSTHQINLALEACHAVLILKKYYHHDNISDYQEMADILLEVIRKQFSQNGNYTSAQQLYNEARQRLDDFFFYNNAFDSRQEVYDLAVHLFEQEKYKGNSFIFMNNMHIWKEEPDYPKDYHGLMIKYAREHGNTFSREDAISYFEQIGSTTPAATFSNVIFNTGRQSFLQYDENQFVLTEAIQINDYFLSSVSGQIENLLEDEDYIATGEIDDYFYTTLPKLPSGIFWSALLLEDVLRIYETGFTTIEAGKDNDKKTIPAAIVRKKSHYRSFSDVVWNEVSKSFSLPKEFTASEFREFLLNKGFIRGSEKMWSVHKTVAGDIRFYWTDNNGRVTIN